MKKREVVLSLCAVCLTIFGCQQEDKNLLGDDIRLFKGQAWELAQAVESQDTLKIKQIIAEHKIAVDYQEPKFGETLLEWAVWTNHYDSSKALLENGADPNLQDHYNGYTAFTFAAAKFETSQYVKLLLKYKADPNVIAKNVKSMYPSPFIAAAYHRLESTKLLADAGADINYISKTNKNALSAAFTFDKVDIVHYLLIDKKADFNQPFGQTVNGQDITITNLLRGWLFPLNSKEYKEKMEIVNYLKGKGVDYSKAPIPQRYYAKYPKEYLDKY